MKKMKKKCIVSLAALLLMIGPLKAQVFIADDEFEGMLRKSDPEYALFVPYQGSDADQFFTPVGSGVLLLAGLGGAYLLTKRKKRK
jgi:hypothetical protein